MITIQTDYPIVRLLFISVSVFFIFLILYIEHKIKDKSKKYKDEIFIKLGLIVCIIYSLLIILTKLFLL